MSNLRHYACNSSNFENRLACCSSYKSGVSRTRIRPVNARHQQSTHATGLIPCHSCPFIFATGQGRANEAVSSSLQLTSLLSTRLNSIPPPEDSWIKPYAHEMIDPCGPLFILPHAQQDLSDRSNINIAVANPILACCMSYNWLYSKRKCLVLSAESYYGVQESCFLGSINTWPSSWIFLRFFNTGTLQIKSFLFLNYSKSPDLL